MPNLVTDPLVREIVVSVYHHVKNNPDTWHQDEWRCGSGMCFAGWMVAAAAPEVLIVADQNSCQSIGSTSGLDSSHLAEWTQHFEEVDNYFCISSAAEAILGISPYVQVLFTQLVPGDYEIGDIAGWSLFDGNNSISEIREILWALLGEDPEEIVPSEDILLSTKREAAYFEPSADAVTHHRRNALRPPRFEIA